MEFTREGSGCKEIDEKLFMFWSCLHDGPVEMRMNASMIWKLASLFSMVETTAEVSYINKFAMVVNQFEAYIQVVLDNNLEMGIVRFVFELK